MVSSASQEEWMFSQGAGSASFVVDELCVELGAEKSWRKTQRTGQKRGVRKRLCTAVEAEETGRSPREMVRKTKERGRYGCKSINGGFPCHVAQSTWFPGSLPWPPPGHISASLALPTLHPPCFCPAQKTRVTDAGILPDTLKKPMPYS